MIEIIIHAAVHPDNVQGLKEALAMDVEKYGNRVIVVSVRDMDKAEPERQVTIEGMRI